MNYQSNNAFQYMHDVGVPPADVTWLADYKRSPVPATAAERARALQIEEAAYAGLLGTIINRSHVASVCQ
jgi:hypothetical protein